MTLEYWQITYVLAVLIGLLIGWISNPWFGAVFIWTFVIVVEVLGFQKKKRIEKVRARTQGATRA
jgi:F0F1-type ATP synthase assembly protein I